MARRALVLTALASFGAPAAAAAQPVDITTRVPVDGAELFLQMRGADRDSPVVLWLHGGPGGAERPLFRLFNGSLEHCVVSAYVDQRGAGHSFDPDADPERLTIDTHVADLELIVNHLRERLDVPAVVLLGHSWGTTLALLHAQRRPETVRHVIAVAPLVDTRATWQAEYEFVRAEARRRDDERTLQALEEIGAPPYASAGDVLAVERLADRFGAVFHQPLCRLCVLARGTLRRLVAPWDLPGFIRANDRSLQAMHDELSRLNLFEQAPRLAVPVTFLLGRFDRHLDSRLAAAYAARLQAPASRVVWFDHSAHNVPFEEPERFGQIVLQTLGISLDCLEDR